MPFTKFQKSCVAIAIGQAITPSVLFATTINVDATCTLAQAVETANSDSVVGDCEQGNLADTIELPLNETITLEAVTVNGLPVVTSEITINGNGATVERSVMDVNDFRLIEVESPSAVLTMSSLTLRGGRATADSFPNFHGGAIYLHDSATLIGHDLIITGNLAMSPSGTGGNGGGIYAEHSTVSLTNTVIDNNSAYGSGGGIGGAYSSITLNNSTISNGFARGGGGGVNSTAGTLNATSVTISNNTVGTASTSVRGGGIKVFYQASLTLIDSTINGNTATREGGGISIRPKVKANISGTTISQNSANAGGAGLHIETVDDVYSSATFSNVTIDSNVVGEASGSTRRGGGMEVEGAVLNATNLNLTNNVALGSRAFGGGLHASGNASISLNGGLVSGNSAHFSTGLSTAAGGAGISLDSASLIANDLTIISNSSLGGIPRGAGILALGSSVDLTSSSVSSNVGSGSSAVGAGIYIGDTAGIINSILSLSDSTIDGNMAIGTLGGAGAGIVVGPKTAATIDRSTISNNHSNATISKAGGLLVSCGNPLATSYACTTSLSNSTISGNSAAIGGGVTVYEAAMFESFNSTIYANQAASNGSQLVTEGLPTIDLSNTLIGTSSIAACYNTQMGFTFNTNSSNWMSDSSCDSNASGNPNVGPLSDNGGPTLTHLPDSQSGLAKLGSATICLSPIINGLDQRGEVREDPCSIGSVETPKAEASFFVIPLANGKSVIFGL